MGELKRYDVPATKAIRIAGEMIRKTEGEWVKHEDAAAEIASLKRENERLSVRVHDLEVQQSVMRESFAQTEAMREQAEVKVVELEQQVAHYRTLLRREQRIMARLSSRPESS